MIAKISHGSSLYGALAYNQQKVDAEKGKILECNLVMTPPDGRFNVYDCVADFERFTPSHGRTAKPVVHISLNPHPEDKLTDEQLADIGREYLDRMGYGNQPWMIFKHEDIDRQHLHIVTTRVRSDGTLVSDKNNYERSRKITDDLERKYGLHAKERRQGEAWQLTPVDAAVGELKRQVGSVVKPLSEMYRFRSLAEYRALLSLYNIGVEKIEGDNKGHRYAGLVYSALDPDGNRIGQPLKSSLFGRKYGIASLEATMLKSGEAIQAGNAVAGIKGIVSAALADSRDGSEFRVALRGKGIDLVLRHNDEGRLYGVTFIDHRSRTVLNGSALGKEFSANALSARFGGFADVGRREGLQPTLSASSPMGNEQVVSAPTSSVDEIVTPFAPVGNARRAPEPVLLPSLPSASDDRASDGRSATLDLSTVGEAAGSLFSLLTPEPGPTDEKPSGPKRRKKKKRQYGRQE
jgi:hypothetical protein